MVKRPLIKSITSATLSSSISHANTAAATIITLHVGRIHTQTVNIGAVTVSSLASYLVLGATLKPKIKLKICEAGYATNS